MLCVCTLSTFMTSAGFRTMSYWTIETGWLSDTRSKLFPPFTVFLFLLFCAFASLGCPHFNNIESRLICYSCGQNSTHSVLNPQFPGLAPFCIFSKLTTNLKSEIPYTVSGEIPFKRGKAEFKSENVIICCPFQTYTKPQAGGRWTEQWESDYCQGKTKENAVKTGVP